MSWACVQMSSMAKYSEIPRESSHLASYSRRKMSINCFESQDEDYHPRFTKKTFSTNSLPRPGKRSTIFEVTRFPPDDVAGQICLIDSDLFSKIDIEELISCGWIKKNKLQIAPSICAYTRKFNYLSYWVVEEILDEETSKGRAQKICYWVAVAKRLHELNNLHSLFAIVSALRSASIYRLSKTWSIVARKEKKLLETFVELFSENDNFFKLREHLNTLRLPCVPYIGIYLTDLVYLSMANPNGNLKDSISANNIFRIVSVYQSSSYSNLPRDYQLQNKLKSVSYIDELLKFVEDDNYKKSLTLEPPTTEQSPVKFVPGHKKTSSWGNKIKLSPNESTSSESLRNLIDDSVLEKSEDSREGLSIEVCGGDEPVIADIALEGCLRRKTLLKNGKKPPMAAWQRYWIVVWGNVLLYYCAKSLLQSSDRLDFHREPSKMKSLQGCLIQMADDPLHPDSFHIANPQTGSMYKFRTGSLSRAHEWCRTLQECQKNTNRPTNLIKFD